MVHPYAAAVVRAAARTSIASSTSLRFQRLALGETLMEALDADFDASPERRGINRAEAADQCAHRWGIEQSIVVGHYRFLVAH